MNTEIRGARVSFSSRRLAEPLILSSGTITEVTEAEATVQVRVEGIEATGKGSIYLSDLWAWPGTPPSREQKLEAMIKYCTYVAHELTAICYGACHPLEQGLRLHDQCVDRNPTQLVDSRLARALCSSPFDAAIHDATGLALGRSAMSFYEERELKIPSSDDLFGGNTCEAIQSMIRKPPHSLPAWYIAGPTTTDEALHTAISTHGIRRVKMKTSGTDVRKDAERTAAVFRVAKKVLGNGYRPADESNRLGLVVDSNEASPSEKSVLEYLEILESIDPEAYLALEYLEQPTPRDIAKHAYDWSKIAKRKPVLIDEGLTGVDSFDVARRQGWSGFALKTCKGHSFALVAAAWAFKNGMYISLQDLTNPGYSAIHGAILASYLPTINGVELNSWQFTPEANERWMPRLSELLIPHNGVHVMPNANTAGLGSEL